MTVLLVSPSALAEYSEGMEHYRKAWAAYATQDYAQAEEWGKRAVRADPENAHAHALLGDMAYLRHDLTQAKSSWERALKVNPALAAIQGQISQAEMEMKLEREMEPVQLGSLVVRMPRSVRPSTDSGRTAEPVRAELVEALSQAMEKLEPYFQYRVNRPLAVLIYPREAFYEMNHLPTEVLGLFDGKVRVPAPAVRPEQAVRPSTELRVNGASKDDSLERVLWHEYAHAVVFDLSHGRAPRWLHEGLAQEAEKIERGQALFLKQLDLTGEKVPDPFFRTVMGISERPGEPVVMSAGIFYAASHSLVRYLLELKGWDRMRRFLATLGQGSAVEKALQKEYGLDLVTLEKKWKEWYHSN